MYRLTYVAAFVALGFVALMAFPIFLVLVVIYGLVGLAALFL